MVFSGTYSCSSYSPVEIDVGTVDHRYVVLVSPRFSFSLFGWLRQMYFWTLVTAKKKLTNGVPAIPATFIYQNSAVCPPAISHEDNESIFNSGIQTVSQTCKQNIFSSAYEFCLPAGFLKPRRK